MISLTPNRIDEWLRARVCVPVLLTHLVDDELREVHAGDVREAVVEHVAAQARVAAPDHQHARLLADVVLQVCLQLFVLAIPLIY